MACLKWNESVGVIQSNPLRGKTEYTTGSIGVFLPVSVAFLSTLHRYFSADMQNDAHNFLSFRAFVRVQRSVEILDERRITCNKI